MIHRREVGIINFATGKLVTSIENTNSYKVRSLGVNLIIRDTACNVHEDVDSLIILQELS